MIPPSLPSKSRTGFTLTELLIVVAILGILLTLMMPTIRSTMAASRQTQCLTNLRTLCTAAHQFAADNNNCFPIGWNSPASWTSQIFPYTKIYPSYQQNEVGPTFCPETRTGGEGINRRNATQWLTDYNANRFVFSGVLRDNNSAKMPGSRIMLFDGQGGMSGGPTTSNQRLRHSEGFCVIYVNGSAERLASFDEHNARWSAE